MTTDANRFRREAYSFSLLTVDNLRRLNAETKTVEVQSRSKIDDIIDKQTNDYLASLDKKTRSQLSKTQLVKSHQKVYAWKKKNRQLQHAGPSRTIPKEYLMQDNEPTLYSSKFLKSSNISDSEQSSNQSSASPSTSTGGSNTATTGWATEQVLEGEVIFEKEILPSSKFSAEEMKKRTGTIKDWLSKRQLKFQERDRMRKFAMTLTKKDSMSLDDVVKSYLKKKKTQEYTFEELREIYNMTDNKDLSTNDLLRLFRKEVPAVEGDQMDTDDDEEMEDEPTPPVNNTNAMAKPTASVMLASQTSVNNTGQVSRHVPSKSTSVNPLKTSNKQ
jgi:hypothetical protein